MTTQEAPTQEATGTAAARDSGPSVAGMGSIPHKNGVAFRVWAPHAEQVAVIGTFNDWQTETNPMRHEHNGYWYTSIREAKAGDEYRFFIKNGQFEAKRIDPYAKQVTSSVGNAIVEDPDFDWGDDDRFRTPPVNEMVVYEMHVGTFGKGADATTVRNFDDAIKGLDHLHKLGINAIEIMPVTEFAGDRSWGYNPAHPFAVESAYGGPRALKQFVKEAHRKGIAVLLDIVYNHFGPSDLDLWQFDGWHENNLGGIYFYQDSRSETPWGNTRPDYGRPEVRNYIRDNALMWMEDFHMDGLRMDATLYIRAMGYGAPSGDLPDGWSLVQWINDEIQSRFPGRITIAEDLQNNEWLTKSTRHGGAGFHAQWCAGFVHPVRAAVTAVDDAQRSMNELAAAIGHFYNGEPFQRVIYSESHDEVANGKSRVVSEIDPNDTGGWHARKRSTLAASLVLTSPGIPMLFQGQEFLTAGWFDDTVPLDWERRKEFGGIVRLYRDLIVLRLNREGFTKGLTASNLEYSMVDDSRKLIVYRRWYYGGAGDDVMVALNFSNVPSGPLDATFPTAGFWQLRLNSDWWGYSGDFRSVATGVDARMVDGRVLATLEIPAYSVLIYSQEPAG